MTGPARQRLFGLCSLRPTDLEPVSNQPRLHGGFELRAVGKFAGLGQPFERQFVVVGMAGLAGEVGCLRGPRVGQGGL